jgi:hypothetical protein
MPMTEGDLECKCQPRVNKDADGFWLQPIYACYRCGKCYHDPEGRAKWLALHPSKPKSPKPKAVKGKKS